MDASPEQIYVILDREEPALRQAALDICKSIIASGLRCYISGLKVGEGLVTDAQGTHVVSWKVFPSSVSLSRAFAPRFREGVVADAVLHNGLMPTAIEVGAIYERGCDSRSITLEAILQEFQLVYSYAQVTPQFLDALLALEAAKCSAERKQEVDRMINWLCRNLNGILDDREQLGHLRARDDVYDVTDALTNLYLPYGESDIDD